MFSKLDGIFKGLPPRHAERADARLEIRRDESRNQGRKNDGGHDSEYVSPEWDDTAYVSIPSLKAFLESMVAPAPEDVTPPAPPVHEAVNTISQRAANAYQSVGRKGHDENVYAPQAPQPAPIETNFSDDELARLRGYIHDLVELARAGVTEIAMQRSANFLESIGAAIAQARAGLGA